MPAIADVTIKKDDGVTDVAYTAIVPSAGDKSPALWRNQTVGTATAHRPTLTLQSRNNGSGTARRMEGSLTWPTTVTGSDGKVVVVDKAIIGINALLPLGMPETEIDEAVSQTLNLFNSALLKASLKAGYAPT